jgi:hypothetical protein
VTFCAISLRLGEPGIADREEIFNRHLEALGYRLFLMVMLFGIAAVLYLKDAVSNYLEKTRKNRE